MSCLQVLAAITLALRPTVQAYRRNVADLLAQPCEPANSPVPSVFYYIPLKGNFMKPLLTALILAPLLAFTALAHAQGHSDKQTQVDIERHRAVAAAHEAAAQCLESGKGHDQCLKDLQAACKGLAIGKYCGMKHAH